MWLPPAELRGGCLGGGAAGGHRVPADTADSTHNVCRLLKPEELSALLERPIIFANVLEAEPDFGSCEWSDSSGKEVFWLTAYWAGGKEQWDKWRAEAGVMRGPWHIPRAETEFAALASTLLSRMGQKPGG